MSIISLANIFSHSVGFLFNLSIVSFAVQKCLIGFHLFIFTFTSFASGDWSKKILLQFTSKNIMPMFSSVSFMAYGFTFRSLNHFEFIFTYSVRNCSNLILLLVAIQFSQHPYWRDCLFSIAYSCLFNHGLIDHRYMGVFLGSLFFSIHLCVCFCANVMLFYCNSVA